MARFILVPGGWHGGWAFDAVGKVLAGQGHEVQALTLSGLGDEPAAGANLARHIAEAAQAIRASDAPAVLVGHRSVERRVGKKWVSTCRSRWWAVQLKKNKNNT